jgi:carboxyl-terminal processing protease
MTFRSKTTTLLAGTAIAAALVILSFKAGEAENAPRSTPQQTQTETYRALNLFGDVFEQVRDNYVEPVDDKKLIEYALNGMLTSLDPHSGYMTAEETKSMSIQNRGEFGGLGIEVTMENNVVKVISPIDDTPAARAGVQAGDLIVEIDGKPVLGMSLNDAVDKMRGKVGTEIVLTVVRTGTAEPLKLKLTRATIQIQSVRHRVEGGNIGYIRMSAFNAQTFPGLQKSFEDFDKQTGDKKIVGYVLDLRNNPGGLLDQAIAVSDAFLERGEIVSTRGRSKDDMRRDNATPGDLAHGKPVVVLINGGSASASEIVAGALQDQKRAIIMGTQSFGKGSVQTLVDVPGGGSIKLTTARYYTPSGRSIQGKGITPDITVEQAKVVADKKPLLGELHEADLKGALANPDDAKKPATPASQPTLMPDKDDSGAKTDGKDKKDADDKDSDFQLMRAIDLIQGISLYKADDAAVSTADKKTL